jgi:subtilisin-like proprotein convertase family protein
MEANMKMKAFAKRSFRKSGMLRRMLACGFVLLLTCSMAVPTWAVVFTNPAAITINDATTIGTGNPYPANISVSGLMGNVTNVTVTLSNLNHTFPDDFDMLLVGPTGANLILMSDVGGSDDVVNRTITFDDAAANSAPDATTLNTGTFKPTNIGAGDTWPAPAPAPSANTTLAAAFNGTNPNGTWSLYVADDLGVDMGDIANGWSLTITTDMSSATTFTSGGTIFGGDGARGRATPYASTITASGLTGAITDVNVTLTNLNHLNPDDLDIVLIGPSGKRIILLSDAGGATDVANANLTFDDAGAATVPDAGPLVTATVKPTNFGTGDTMPDLMPPYPNSTTAGTATLASVFNGTDPNGTWSLYVVDDATTSAGTIMGGWSIDITAGGTGGAKRFTSGDFDGDGLTDVAVFRESDHNWYYRDSRSYANHVYPAFGDTDDILVPADYDGDHKTDFAVFRPSQGRWYIVQSTNSTLRQVAWGTNGDSPVPADYDGDGLVDLAVWRSGVWYVLQSTNSTGRVVSWGSSGDLPLRGHFEGTGGADFAVYRSSNNTWYILNNAASSSRVVTLGATGDQPAPADYDADGKTDIAVYRDSSADWFILLSTTSAVLGQHWGVTGDEPSPGDYDGDSRADVAVFRPSTGSWYILNSGTPAGAAALRADNWGQSGDEPVPETYLPPDE